MGRSGGTGRLWSVAALAALGLAAAGALGGCTSAPSITSTESAATQLQQAAGSLDAANTFRLTVDTLIPKTGTAQTAAPPAGPSAQPAVSTVKMSGVWDVGTGLARMVGTVNTVPTTILSASGVEYVSLTADVAGKSGKKWLKADDSDATFGDFCNPRLVAQLLRAYHEVHMVAAGHLSGTIETAEADRTIADPNLVASLAGYPPSIAFDLWTSGAGDPRRILFTLKGAGAVTTGTAQLDSFGTAPAQVNVPTIAEIVQAPSR
jgi:hypothetical protein